MPKIFDKDSGVELGTITDAQLQFLRDQLVEESSADRDYFVNQDTLEVLEESGADSALIKLLRGALGDREDMEIEWTES